MALAGGRLREEELGAVAFLQGTYAPRSGGTGLSARTSAKLTGNVEAAARRSGQKQ